MDTTTRTWIRRITAAAALIGTLATFGPEGQAASTTPVASPAPQITISGAEPDDEAAVDWALRRYREGDLEHMPSLDVHLHRSHDGCQGGMGLYHAGRIDLCTMDSSERYARKYALHEMAHAWTESNLDALVIERFMRVRGIAAWNDRADAWKDRGIEQVAEVITWGLGEGGIAPLLPAPTPAAELADLYEMLTGRAPITPDAVG